MQIAVDQERSNRTRSWQVPVGSRERIIGVGQREIHRQARCRFQGVRYVGVDLLAPRYIFSFGEHFWEMLKSGALNGNTDIGKRKLQQIPDGGEGRGDGNARLSSLGRIEHAATERVIEVLPHPEINRTVVATEFPGIFSVEVGEIRDELRLRSRNVSGLSLFAAEL